MASYRKSKLNDNSAFLQFNWKADVVESWIGMLKFWGFFVFLLVQIDRCNFLFKCISLVLNLVAPFVFFR